MIDIDFGPGVFAGIIFCVFLFPLLYSQIVDKHWKQHKEDPNFMKAGGFDD